MLHIQTFKFLNSLNKNNNKEWFDKNRDLYQEVREALLKTVGSTISNMNSFEPLIAQLDARKCIFRINRDIRFSKNKSPYKNNMGAWFNKGGKKINNAGYYFHVEPNNCFVAAGLYMPEADIIKKIRQEIDYNGADINKLLNTSTFKKNFGALSTEHTLVTMPKGYDSSHDMANLLKLKSFIVTKKYTEKEFADKNIAKLICKDFEKAKPLVDFLNIAFD